MLSQCKLHNKDSGSLLTAVNGVLGQTSICKVVDRPYSEIIFLRCTEGNKILNYVLKIIKHHPDNIRLTAGKNQAVVEFEALSRLYPIFAEIPQCSVPRPIAVFPEFESYLMESVPGILLNERLKDARYFSSRERFKELIFLYQACGKWLHLFQTSSPCCNGAATVFDQTIRRCEEKLDLIEKSKDPRIPSHFSSIIMDRINGELDKIKNTPIPVCIRHGDFGGWNIIVDNEGITVIDFLGADYDFKGIDVLKMLINFEDEKKYLAYSTKKINVLAEAFLDGYGQEEALPCSALMISEILHRLCSLSASLSNSPEVGFKRSLEKKLCFREHLSWLTDVNKVPIWGLGYNGAN